MFKIEHGSGLRAKPNRVQLMQAAAKPALAKILIVDDEAANRAVLVSLLRPSGHSVIEARNGAEALAKVRAEHPALVITDILMPNMDGYEFVRQLRADPETAQTRVVFYTATYKARDARELAEACGVRHVLTKPCDPRTILNTVREALTEEPGDEQTVPLREFNQKHKRLLTDKLSQKVHELETANYRLSALLDITRQVAAEREPVAMLRNLCAPLRAILAADHAAVGLFDESKTSLARFFLDGTETRPPDIANGALNGLVRSNEPLRMEDISSDPLGGSLPDAQDAGHFVGSLLHNSFGTHGLLFATRARQSQAFTEDDERTVAAVATHVCVSYENLRHFEQLTLTQAAIRELSTPVLPIGQQLLLVPLIGELDTERATQLTSQLLNAVRDCRARAVVIDVTGVATIETRAANHLIQTGEACRLLGATVVLSGISSDVARALVALDIDFRSLITTGDLQGGIAEASRLGGGLLPG